MFRSPRAVMTYGAVVLTALGVALAPGLEAADSSVVVRGSDYRVDITAKTLSTSAARELLGVHSLWWGHDEGLFTAGTTSTRPEVVDFLSAAGGILRFGGGANEISWRACSGDAYSRPKVKAAAWAGPMQCRFGVDQYLDLVTRSGAKSSWFIANIAGIDYVPMPVETMANEAAAFAVAVRDDAPGLLRFWELGNELERGRYGWPPEKLGERASVAGAAILKADKAAQLIVPLIEFNHPNQPRRSAFNQRVLENISVPVAGFAMHLYYDGRHGGPSIPTQLNTISETADQVKNSRHKAAGLWITEHGRWPAGDTTEPGWRNRWSQTNDMDGVISTADFLIGLSQIPGVAGAMLHGLRTGPWNVVDTEGGDIRLTGVGQLLSLLGTSGAEVRLLSRTTSRNQSEYVGGYDVRASAFEDRDRQHLVVWVANRSPAPAPITLTSERLLRLDAEPQGRSLVCVRPPQDCRTQHFRVVPLNQAQVTANDGHLQITLPAHSVSVLRLERVK